MRLKEKRHVSMFIIRDYYIYGAGRYLRLSPLVNVMNQELVKSCRACAQTGDNALAWPVTLQPIAQATVSACSG